MTNWSVTWKRAAKRSHRVAREALALAWAWVWANEQTWQMYENMARDRDHYARSCDKLIHRAITAEMECDRMRKELETVERWNGSLKEDREYLLEMLRARKTEGTA